MKREAPSSKAEYGRITGSCWGGRSTNMVPVSTLVLPFAAFCRGFNEGRETGPAPDLDGREQQSKQ